MIPIVHTKDKEHLLSVEMKKELAHAQKRGIIVSLYDDYDDRDVFSVGYVDQISDTHVRLKAVNENCEFSGYEIRALSDIYKLEYNGKYEKKIQKINNNIYKVFKEIEPIMDIKNNLVLSALMQSQKEKIFLCIWGNDPDDFQEGYVEKVSKKTIKFRLVNQHGEDDGVVVMKIDEITNVNFNSKRAQISSYLHSLQN